MLRWSVQTHRINVYFPLYTSFQNNQLISGITQKWHWGLCDFPSQNHNELFGQNKLMCLCSNPLWLFLLPFYFSFFFLKKRFYLFIFRERGREGEREGEKHQGGVASHLPTGDLACNPGMFLDWKLNLRSFGSQARAQSTELHQPRSLLLFSGYL